MPQITIVPTSAKVAGLQPIVLSQPTPAELADIVSTLRSNGISYSIKYGGSNSNGFSYPVAASFTSR